MVKKSITFEKKDLHKHDEIVRIDIESYSPWDRSNSQKIIELTKEEYEEKKTIKITKVCIEYEIEKVK